MSLQEKLRERKAQSAASRPPEVGATMQRAVNELRATGIMDRVLKVGDRAPDFTLPNVQGQQVSSGELLAKGPLVVGFYRGRW